MGDGDGSSGCSNKLAALPPSSVDIDMWLVAFTSYFHDLLVTTADGGGYSLLPSATKGDELGREVVVVLR